ncbi:DUF739 family protein [uncultured Dubosiella sp.]|uniref:DUF739 family protein n=1 Tax=uncultured Dubosiella sp. TaxID=1937011 RepID=UPI0025956FE7|nr:DUF739 family protein [uncultured Dubosiella sp.]
MFDYKPLRGKIREICGSEEEFAKRLGISKTSLSGRLNNKLEFSSKEIMKSCEILGISLDNVSKYFFECGV